MKKVAKGVRSVYGQAIGIIMLDSTVPVIPGAPGNATTWDFPVAYRVARGASGTKVVEEGDPELVNCLIEAACDLEQLGVRAITANCGFLALFQDQIANAVNIPVFVSSLIQVPLVYRMLKKDQKVGIITVHSGFLSEKHLAAVGADSIPVVIVGMENEEEFTRYLLENRSSFDIEKAENEVVAVAKKMLIQNPEVGGVVLECTALPSYAKAIQDEISLPVFDIVTLTKMVYDAVVRREFTGFM